MEANRAWRRIPPAMRLFGRKPKESEGAASARQELLPSQLDNTRRYGWQKSSPGDVKKTIFDLLERPPGDDQSPIDRPAD